MTDLDRLLYDMAKLADSDIPIDQGRVYNIGDKTIFYFSFFPYLSDNADYHSKEVVDQLTELKKYSLVIADFSKERMDHNPLYDVLEQLGLNFIMLTHNITQHKTRPKLLYYPVLYHWARCQFQRQSISTLHKKYKLSCLNGTLRWHRVYNYLLLKSRPDFNDYLCTLHYQPELEDAQELQARANISDEIIQQWELIKNHLPHRDQLGQENKIRADWDIVHPACTNSYINLVTETDMSNAFVTEKTWKPVASAQLFLIVGHRNAVAHLRSLGVDTFDDIIDHAYYDNEADWQIRIQKIHQVLDKLLSQDLESIYKDTEQRRTSNSKKFFNGEFGTEYQNNLVTCITTPK
jgi:hypothetical protein